MSELIARLHPVLAQISVGYEIILVDDLSPDGSWKIIKSLCDRDKKVKAAQLSRNFGQHQAITAGLDQAKGEWVVVMDCDLQDVPEEIIKLYNRSREGYEMVLAGRFDRQDSFFKKFFSKYFYKVLSYLTETRLDESVGNFGIYNRKVVNAVLSMRENIRFFPLLVRWTGFRSVIIPVEHAARIKGRSNYSFRKLLKLALGVMLAFSDKPLRQVVKLGVTMSLLAFLFAMYNLYKYYRGVITEPGFTSLIISIWFLSGVIIAVIGIVGLYVGKIFEQAKNRPIYIINKKENL